MTKTNANSKNSKAGPALTWHETFNQLKAYQEENGNINIHPTEFKDTKLGRWVQIQRLSYMHYRANHDDTHLAKGMCPDRVKLLESIGFQWNIPYNAGSTSTSATSSADTGTERSGEAQVTTPIRQRIPKKKRKYNDIHDDDNDKTIGNNNDNEKVKGVASINDNMKQSVVWEHKFKKLLKFKKIHKHCDVPREYILDPKLGKWVDYQRTGYKNFLIGQSRGKNGMNKVRIKRLEALDFVWSFRDQGKKPKPLNYAYIQKMNAIRKKRKSSGHDSYDDEDSDLDGNIGNSGDDFNDSDNDIVQSLATSSSSLKKKRKIDNDDDVNSPSSKSLSKKTKKKKKKPTFSTSLKDIIDSKLTSTKTSSGIKKPNKMETSITSPPVTPSKDKGDSKNNISKNSSSPRCDSKSDANNGTGSQSIAEIILRKYGLYKEGTTIDYTTFRSLGHYYYLKNNGWDCR